MTRKYETIMLISPMTKKSITRLIVGFISTNCWIYQYDEKKCAIIDPGDEAGKIISTLNKLSLVPEYILLTHGHFDHIIAVPQLVQSFSVKPKIAIHRLDSEYLGKDAYKTHRNSIKFAMGNTSFLDSLWNDIPPADCLLEDGDIVGPFLTLHTGGHTPGSICFWDKSEGALFTGDTLFKGTYGRTDLPGGNETEIQNSLSRLFAMESSIKVYPGHEETTTIGQEAALFGK